MKFIDKVTIPFKRGYSIVATQASAHAPEIELVVGGACLVSSIFLAYRAGKKSQRENYKERLEEALHEARRQRGPAHLKKTARKTAIKDYAISTGKNLGPTLGTGVVGGYLIVKSFMRLKARNELLMGALAAATASSKAVDMSLRESFGEAGRDELVSKGHVEKVTELKKDELGNELPIKEDTLIINFEDIDSIPPEAFIYSKATVSKGEFIDDDNYFEDIMSGAMAEGNLNLHKIQGYWFIENFMKPFGVEANPTQKSNGWLYPDPKRPLPGDDQLQCGINPYARKIFIRYDDGSMEKGYLIFPHSDGFIMDRYSHYSLNRLLKR